MPISKTVLYLDTDETRVKHLVAVWKGYKLSVCRNITEFIEHLNTTKEYNVIGLTYNLGKEYQLIKSNEGGLNFFMNNGLGAVNALKVYKPKILTISVYSSNIITAPMMVKELRECGYDAWHYPIQRRKDNDLYFE